MQLVQSCIHHPGEAIGGGGSENVVDTGFELPFQAGRLYLGHQHSLEIGVAAGLPTLQTYNAALEALEFAEQRAQAAEADLIAAKLAIEEAESLRVAIAYTLERGVVVDKRTMTLGLRHKPGQRRIDLSRSIWEPFVTGEGSPEPVEPEPATA